MTTYNGRSASYIPGKEVPNKEPPVSKYVIEKLYKVHRERLQKVEHIVDSHVEIPEFLTNQTWKKNAERQKLIDVQKENQEMYTRISRLENEESQITKENKAHIKRVEIKLNYLRKLKRHGRLVQMVKIQRENEHLLKRLEKAKPQYTLKKCKEWYKYHEHYKNGRRSDPTAGHIMSGMKGLLPPALPSLSSTLSPSAATRKEDPLDAYLRQRSLEKTPLPSLDGRSHAQSSGSLATHSMLSSQADSGSLSKTMHERSTVYSRDTNSQQKDRARSVQSAPSLHLPDSEQSSIQNESLMFASHQQQLAASGSGSTCSGSYYREDNSDNEDGTYDDASFDRDNPVSVVSDFSREPSVSDIAADELFLLSARPFALPFESKSCMVQVFTSREYDENLRLRVVNNGLTHEILAERLIPIDKAYEVISAGGHSSQIVHSTDNEDLQSLSTLLINMFKEADEDGSGSLTFDEFQQLMEQVELGISSQELRFVISEADENENGVVDYEEFVPLAVDLIQSFRARNRAKAINSHEDVLVDDMIYKSISQVELQSTADLCLEKLLEIDSKRYGLIRVPELKKALNSIAASANLRETEISLLSQMLPRDQFGRVKYNATPTAFFDTLSKVRFMSMKNAMVEAHGSGLQKYLLELCKDEEMRNENFQGPKEKFVPNGIISCRSLISILSNSSRLSLSRLQVLVIMSEASVLDGMINYFQFLPIVAKAIEIMFEPKALRQRAELIEKTDLSPEALLQGMSSDMFEQRLLTLFKSYDIDHNGMLDQSEFIACLESLDLQLTYGEMVALMAAADTEQRGNLKFEEFVGFFTHNLLNLEKEKRLRLLQSSMQKDSQVSHSPSRRTAKQESELDLITRLTHLFQLYDPDGSGFIGFEDFDSLLHNFSVHSSKFLMDLMLSELQVNDDGLVEYSKSLKLCGDLLKVFKSKESELEEHKQREAEAELKALKFAQISVEETNRIVKFLRQRISEISETAHDAFTKYQEIQQVIRSPYSGLSKNEANMIISKLFMGLARGDHNHSSLSLKSKTHSPSDNSAAPGAVSPTGTGTIGEKRIISRAKSMNFSYSGQELFDVVFEARKTTIMRTLLRDNIDSTSVKQLILSSLTKELDRRKKRNEINNDSSFLPLQACSDVLDSLNQFRLTRAQIMFILSCADCYDRDGNALEVYRFADHAAAIITNINSVEILETRAEVINHSSIDDRKVLHGMQEKDVVKYLEYSFLKLNEQNPEETKFRVTKEQIRAALKDLTRLRLTDREITTILVSLNMTSQGHLPAPTLAVKVSRSQSKSVSHSPKASVAQLPSPSEKLDRPLSAKSVDSIGGDSLDDSREELDLEEPGRVLPEDYDWKEQLPLIVESIRTLKRETMINRRVSLAATSMALQNRSSSSVCASTETRKLQQDSMKQLTDLAEKLLNYIKLQSQGESITISLPFDGTGRRSSQIATETHIKMQHREIVTLFKGALYVPLTVHRLVQPTHQSFSSSPRPLGSTSTTSSLVPFSTPSSAMRKGQSIRSATPVVESTSSMVPVFFQFDAIEDTQMFSGCSLLVHAVNVDASIHINEQLSVRLPSLSIVDRESAQQYTANLVEKIYFEKDVDHQCPVLKMLD